MKILKIFAAFVICIGLAFAAAYIGKSINNEPVVKQVREVNMKKGVSTPPVQKSKPAVDEEKEAIKGLKLK
jgi:hypothetical protein